MIKFRYNHEKNAKLLLERNIGFEEIIQSINDGNLLGAKLHPDQVKSLLGIFPVACHDYCNQSRTVQRKICRQ